MTATQSGLLYTVIFTRIIYTICCDSQVLVYVCRNVSTERVQWHIQMLSSSCVVSSVIVNALSVEILVCHYIEKVDKLQHFWRLLLDWAGCSSAFDCTLNSCVSCHNIQVFVRLLDMLICYIRSTDLTILLLLNSDSCSVSVLWAGCWNWQLDFIRVRAPAVWRQMVPSCGSTAATCAVSYNLCADVRTNVIPSWTRCHLLSITSSRKSSQSRLPVSSGVWLAALCLVLLFELLCCVLWQW